MSYFAYKNLHVLGVCMVCLALGGLIVQNMQKESPWRVSLLATHGTGLLLVFTAGLGMLTSVDVTWPLPGWLIGKTGIWIVLGLVPALLTRSPAITRSSWWIVLFLCGVAATPALYKPF